MSLANYADLISAIPDYLFGRSDLTARIPDFITLCEAQLNRRLRVQQMEGRFTSTLNQAGDATDAYLAAPTGMITFRRLALTSSTPIRLLEYMTPDEMYSKWNDVNFRRPPKNYSIIGANIQFGPIPDQAYTIEGDYYQQLPPLATNSTNWLMTAFPDIYLYGSLKNAAPFIGNDSRITVWNQLFEQAVTELEMNDQKDRYARSSLTMRVDCQTP